MNRSKLALAVMSLGLLIILFTPYTVAATPTVYRVFVDDWYGFRKVIEANYTPFKYENQTLYINTGDTVFWINDADNESITITNSEGLWPGAYLKYVRQSYNYTFTKPGTYDVYMKEFPRRPHQTIIVAGVETPAVTTPPPTPTPTPTATETTAVTTQAPQEKPPAFNLWYILLALIVVVGIVALIYSQKKK